ncbi:HD domain-containing protein [Hyphomicrobium sp. MC1]|uniref:HD domain-containing protein n=1 Tax=Hyphomicrobium sp. (strain MC1) TaxID=717785 RepID=UPI000213E442|nr:HD domain-containing protein [Hyphomicrobium sp. MC1]CCB66488.1 Metal dependent phosphohydrolase [Hyphomicrobium sp. MC1]
MIVIANSKVETARMFAQQKHGSRLRNLDGVPTISHLENVVEILKDYGYSEPDVLAAAYLHDCLEETETSLQHLVVRFGDHIAELVFWLTDSFDGNRITKALRSAWRLSRAPWEAKLIELADIVENCTRLRSLDLSFAHNYLDDKRQVLRLMAEREGPMLMHSALFQKAVAVTDMAEK